MESTASQESANEGMDVPYLGSQDARRPYESAL